MPSVYQNAYISVLKRLGNIINKNEFQATGFTGGMFLNERLRLPPDKAREDGRSDIDVFVALEKDTSIVFQLEYLFLQLKDHFGNIPTMTVSSKDDYMLHSIDTVTSITKTSTTNKLLSEYDYVHETIDFTVISFYYYKVKIDLLIHFHRPCGSITSALTPIKNFPSVPTRQFLGTVKVKGPGALSYPFWLHAYPEIMSDTIYLKCTTSNDYVERIMYKYSTAGVPYTLHTKSPPTENFKFDIIQSGDWKWK